MQTSQALVPHLLAQHRVDARWTDAAVVLTGAAALSLLAQVAVPLPFTPVPITGQTFGVLLASLTLGSRRAFATVLLYLGLGAAGLPVLAGGAAGLAWGPTLGYLVGMLAASFVVGSLADRGWTRTVPRCYAAALVSSCLVFSCGLAVLSAFVPADQLLVSGLLPFLPGDLVKMTLAIALVRPLHAVLPRSDLHRREG